MKIEPFFNIVKMSKANFYIIILIAIFISACNPKEDIPTYITIEPFEYTPGEDGIYSTKITDGWVYVGNEFIGAFDLPKTIPVLHAGEKSIIIDAGIKENGINATPDLYTFYERYTETRTLVPGETITVKPSTTYDVEITNMNFQEFFDDILAGNHQFKFDLDGNPNTKIEIGNSVVKEGAGSGSVYLDVDNPQFAVGSNYILVPENPGEPTYIEMDYQTDVPLVVGLAGYGISDEFIFSEVNLGVNPKSEWNKIYFNVTEKLYQLSILGSANYRIIIQAQIPRENGEFTLENAEIYLDNIKLVSK